MRRSPARLADLAVMATGLVVLARGCIEDGRGPPTPSIVAHVLFAFVSGLAARAAASRQRRRGEAGFAALAALVVVAAALTLHGEVVGHWLAAPDRYAPRSGLLGILLMDLTPTIVALAGMRLGASSLPFVVGASAAALLMTSRVSDDPVFVVLSFTLARRGGAPPDDGLAVRQRPVLVALGAISAWVALGPLFDVAAALMPTETRLAERPFFHVYVDGIPSFMLRVGLEIALLASTFAFARGRTWGLFGLLFVAPALFATVVAGLASHTLPAWGGGCLVSLHPLGDLMVHLFLGVVVATVPWLVPAARALGPGGRGTDGG